MNLGLIYLISLLGIANIFMSFAWYWHLKDFSDRALYVVILISWSIALFEYIFLIPATRIGSNFLTLSQLKIIQEVITLMVFVPFSIFIMNQPFKIDFLWAGFCLLGAVYFIFR
jgi:uncharacterized protein (DUF486 family)